MLKKSENVQEKGGRMGRVNPSKCGFSFDLCVPFARVPVSLFLVRN